MNNCFLIALTSVFFCLSVLAQDPAPAASGSPEKPSSAAVQPSDVKAEEVIKRAVQTLGGERYLNVRSQVGRGKFSVIKDGVNVSFQSFTDVIVYPDKERTEFKGGGTRTIQVNSGGSGWVYDGDQDQVRDQTEKQVANFQRGLRTSLDNLLRGHWRGTAKLTYVGRRPASLGKRNDVVKLAYDDGFSVEFEFAADDGLPQKALYTTVNPDSEQLAEEDRYAQFVETDGIKAPYIVAHFVKGEPASRINYESISYNVTVPNKAFSKPASAKEAKRDLKL